MARSSALWFNGLCNRYTIIAVSGWPEGVHFPLAAFGIAAHKGAYVTQRGTAGYALGGWQLHRTGLGSPCGGRLQRASRTKAPGEGASCYDSCP
ncbi:hypothetical protein FOXYSP1_15801 [Fusarium oxysporum f. sp. phaseoli]